jgi:phage tail-like protein
MKRGMTAGRFAVDLDGIMAGWVNSVEGGQASADVVSEKVGVDHLVKKHIAGVKYEDITLVCGLGMSRAFYEWIKSSFDRKYLRKNGHIYYADYNGKVVESTEFLHALITEIGFPALDASSKDAAKMTVKFSPETTRQSGGGLHVAPGKFPVGTGQQKKWSPANFRLTIDGLDCTRVNKIEALTVKQKVIDNQLGEFRSYEREPANLEVPNLVITTAHSHAHSFKKWYKSFVIEGNSEEDKEKTGTLEYLTSDLKTVLFTVTFHNLGVFKLTDDKLEAGSESLRRTKVEMYCEEMHFEYHNSTWA